MSGYISEFVKNNRRIISYMLMLFLFITTNLFAQQTNNLEIIWQKTSPDSVFYFGRCIASGDVNSDGYSDIMIVGDSIIDLMGSNPYRGKCWIYYGGSNMDTIPDVQLLNTQEYIFISLHSSDINGDGNSDVIIGTWVNNPDQVLIFLGGNPMDSILDYQLNSYYVGDEYGCAVSSGDVNGDGYDDLLVGAYGAYITSVGYLAGKVYIYLGGPNFDTIPDVILNGGHCNDAEAFGTSIGNSADVNNDGFKDVIIGAANFGTNRGRLYIYYGNDSMDTIADVTMIGENPNNHLGWFGIGGFKNSNNYGYTAISTPLWGPSSPQGYNPGKLYILFGGNLMDSIPDITMVGRTFESTLGMSANTAGDINQDYCDDIIAGAPIESNLNGCAYFWLGGQHLDTIPDAWLSGLQSGNEIGWLVGSAGDVNGDDRDEVIISSSAGWPMKVWVCQYTGAGIEVERIRHNARHLTLQIKPNVTKTFTVIYVSCSWSVKEVKIYDVAGKIVKTFEQVDSRQNTEYREISWNLRNEDNKKVANGIYFVEVIAEINGVMSKGIKKIEVVK